MKITIENANADYQLGKFKTLSEALYYHKKKAGMEKLSRDEMKNITASPINTHKNFFYWMESNMHWVILGGCVALALIAWWGISTGRLI